MGRNMRGTQPGMPRDEAQELRREQLTTHGMRSLPKLIDKGRLPEHLRERRREIVKALATPEGCLGELEQVAVKTLLVVEAGDAWLQEQIAQGVRSREVQEMLKTYGTYLNSARRVLETLYVLKAKAHANVLDLGEEMRRIEEKRATVKAAQETEEVVDYDSE